MADIRQASEEEISACVEDSDVYKTQLNAVMTSRLPAMRKHLNSEIKKVNAALAHLDIAKFKKMDSAEFAQTYDPFAFDPATNRNAKLDRTRVSVQGLEVSDYQEPDMPTKLPSLSFRDPTASDGSSIFGVDIDPKVYEIMSSVTEFACFIVSEVDGGCHGEIFVVNREDALGNQPYIVGLMMEEFTDDQAIAYFSKFFIPTFQDGSEDADEAKMRGILDSFPVN
ncbi:hypothetical protein [Roseibium aggregatum]|nr:hypothetical protein [Roseibium aggregatum]